MTVFSQPMNIDNRDGLKKDPSRQVREFGFLDANFRSGPWYGFLVRIGTDFWYRFLVQRVYLIDMQHSFKGAQISLQY